MAPSKMHGRKTQEWKRRIEMTWVENAGVANTGLCENVMKRPRPVLQEKCMNSVCAIRQHRQHFYVEIHLLSIIICGPGETSHTPTTTAVAAATARMRRQRPQGERDGRGVGFIRTGSVLRAPLTWSVCMGIKCIV